VDITNAAGREIGYRLAASCDVFIENSAWEGGRASVWNEESIRRTSPRTINIGIAALTGHVTIPGRCLEPAIDAGFKHPHRIVRTVGRKRSQILIRRRVRANDSSSTPRPAAFPRGVSINIRRLAATR